MIKTTYSSSRILRLTFFAFSFIFSTLTHAQDGSIDLSFNPSDVGKGTEHGANGKIEALATQTDGKLILAGSFTSINNLHTKRLARMNSDGTIDENFVVNSINDSAFDLAIQADGKIVIGGDFAFQNGWGRVARLNIDGSLDETFNVYSENNLSSGTNSTVYAVAIQADGKIIIGGRFTQYNGIDINRIARLNADGTFDSSFDIGSGAGNQVNNIEIQDDGKILVTGIFNTFNDQQLNGIVLLNSNGSIDNSFTQGEDIITNNQTTVFQEDGKTLSINGGKLVRHNSDGTLDDSFLQSLQTDGELSSIALIDENRILVAGQFSTYDGIAVNNLITLNTDGSVAANHILQNGANGSIYATAIQEDGKVLIGGNFTTYNGKRIYALARLNNDGSIDETFNLSAVMNGSVRVIQILSDNKILIGGSMNVEGFFSDQVLRLNLDGSIDETFSLNQNEVSSVNAIAVQPDGKYVVAGRFSPPSFGGSRKHLLTRLNSDGSVDDSFQIDSNFNTYSEGISLALQSDGKFLMGGRFPSLLGNTKYLCRINTNGSLDYSFEIGSNANNRVRSITIQTDNKIIIGGDFTDFAGTPINRIARLNINGTLDTSFNIGSGANHRVTKCLVLNNGKILVGGDFSSFNESGIDRLVRLNSNGVIDQSFSIGSGTNAETRTFTIQNDNKIIIGGDFTTYDKSGRNRLVRVFGQTCDAPIISSAIEGETIICTGSKNTYRVNNIEGVTFTWILPNGWTGYSTSNSIEITAGTETGKLSVFTTNACGNSPTQLVSLTIKDCSNLSTEKPTSMYLKFYPNPFSNELTIESSDQKLSVDFTIYDVMGKVVMKGNVIGNTKINTWSLKKGIHFIKVDNKEPYKLIKSN